MTDGKRQPPAHWRRRGVGIPVKYGPAHAVDWSRMALMGYYGYCGIWFPAGRDHPWVNASPDAPKCRKCERAQAAVDARAANTPNGPCDSCGNPFTAGQRWIYHARLNVYVHEPCAAGGMRGEDITTHTVTMGQVPGSPTPNTH